MQRRLMQQVMLQNPSKVKQVVDKGLFLKTDAYLFVVHLDSKVS